MPASASTVRRAVSEDLPHLARTLARAFHDDPVMTYLAPAGPEWERRAARFFLAGARHGLHLGDGNVWTATGFEAAAVWAPPGQWKETPSSILRAMPATLSFFRRRVLVALSLLNRMESAHPAAPEHWYLNFLGADPDHQGKGYGAALIGPGLERCDTEGIPAYLVSSKFSNVAFYARHGFEERDPIVIDGGPTLYPMWREPRS